MRHSVEYTILDAVTPVTVTSSTDATPIAVTATAHGFSTGDLVMIQGHTTNVAANGIFSVTRTGANTFTLQNRYTGANVAGSGAGAGSSGICFRAPKIIPVQDFRTVVFNVITSGTATTTLRVAGSLGKALSDTTDGHGDTPNFGATVSKTNPYTFLQIVDLATGTLFAGATGIVVAGSDVAATYEVNTNTFKYLSIFPVTWSQGVITVKALLSNVD